VLLGDSFPNKYFLSLPFPSGKAVEVAEKSEALALDMLS
jgi:hypothetical protein